MMSPTERRHRILVMHQIPRNGLAELFERYEVSFPENQFFSEAELVRLIENQDGLLSVFGRKVSGFLIDSAPGLKIISNYGAGVDNIDVGYASKKGILVTNTPDAVTAATAELTIGLMISVMRRIGESYFNLRARRTVKWGVMENLGTTLKDKRLGIIGMGRIGREVTRLSKTFGMETVYYNRNPLQGAIEQSLNIQYVPLDELLSTSDVVSIHAPLTKETHHMIAGREMRLMKKSAILVNTARGPIVDEDAMIRILTSNKIAGAALDVFEKEPEIPEALLAMDQVVVVPHIGTATHETRHEIARVASQNLIDYFSGNKPRYMVNPEVYQPINS